MSDGGKTDSVRKDVGSKETPSVKCVWAVAQSPDRNDIVKRFYVDADADADFGDARAK